jgi:hypothetical protein
MAETFPTVSPAGVSSKPDSCLNPHTEVHP